MTKTERPMERDLAQTITRASQWDKDAQVTIGDMYRDGKGVAQDYQAAMDWYLMAADQGHAPSQYNIGDLYYFGRGVRQDYVRAMDWFLKAANQDSDVAQFNIGQLYNNGQGVLQDYAKAAEWFSKAADRGHIGSKRALEALKKNGVCCEINIDVSC